MTEFDAWDTGVPLPVRAEGKTKGRFFREDWKNNLIDTGVMLYQSGQCKSLSQASKVISPKYYMDWLSMPDMQSERIKTLSSYIRDKINK